MPAKSVVAFVGTEMKGGWSGEFLSSTVESRNVCNDCADVVNRDV